MLNDTSNGLSPCVPLKRMAALRSSSAIRAAGSMPQPGTNMQNRSPPTRADQRARARAPGQEAARRPE